ncbi:MAG: acyl-CoA dehydrogenase [Actinomycetota bacterium]|nr:acyl-CoA dehydrogenase [Actinomycetota bacterium]
MVPVPSQASDASVHDVGRAGASLARELARARSHSEEVSRRVLRTLASAGAADLGFVRGEGFQRGDVAVAIAHMRSLAEASATVASIYMINTILAGALIEWGGSPRQKASLLPAIHSGTEEFAFALTEPEAGSDAASIQTRALAVESGYVLDGQKRFITGAATADHILIVARTGEARALTIFVVPRSSDGLSVEVQDKLALENHASCRVVLEGVRVGHDAALGEGDGVDRAWALLRRSGALERLVVAGLATGMARTVVSRSIEYARNRQQFGQAISSFQSIQHTLVDSACTLRVMELLVDDAVEAWERGDDPTQTASTAKYLCSQHLQDIVAMGMRVLGGRAFFDFEDMSRLYREAPLTLYAGGTNEIQKNLVARSLGLTA